MLHLSTCLIHFYSKTIFHYFHTLDSSKYSFGWIVTPLTQLLLNVLLALALPPEIWASNRNTAHYKLEINPISSAIETAIKSIWKTFKILFLIPKRAIAMVEVIALILQYIFPIRPTVTNCTIESKKCAVQRHILQKKIYHVWSQIHEWWAEWMCQTPGKNLQYQ